MSPNADVSEPPVAQSIPVEESMVVDERDEHSVSERCETDVSESNTSPIWFRLPLFFNSKTRLTGMKCCARANKALMSNQYHPRASRAHRRQKPNQSLDS
jgi:hypothetical protein